MHPLRAQVVGPERCRARSSPRAETSRREGSASHRRFLQIWGRYAGTCSSTHMPEAARTGRQAGSEERCPGRRHRVLLENVSGCRRSPIDGTPQHEPGVGPIVPRMTGHTPAPTPADSHDDPPRRAAERRNNRYRDQSETALDRAVIIPAAYAGCGYSGDATSAKARTGQPEPSTTGSAPTTSHAPRAGTRWRLTAPSRCQIPAAWVMRCTGKSTA